MPFLVATVLVVLDQLAKAWTVATLPLNAPGIAVWPDVLELNYVRNTGAAFGLFRNVDLSVGPLDVDGTFLLGVLSLVVALWLVRTLARDARALGAWTRAALTLILAGAVGNMIDRFRLGYVVDYVDVYLGSYDFAVFNLADASISVGAVLLVLATLLRDRPRPA
ncbi:MAG: signal peptidase II [Trueperaceae bacterium]|nr:signal peptidase II [Trueperaceae bacterium]